MADDKKPLYEDLKCGNCGFDGGLAHANEKLQWKEENNQLKLEVQKAKAVDNTTYQTRAWVLGLASVFCVSIMSYASCEIIPKSVEAAHSINKILPPVNPVVNAQETLKYMYTKCVEQSHVDNRQDTATGIRACNDTFGQQIQQMKTVEEKK